MHAVSINDFYWRYPNFTGIKGDYALKAISLEINEGEFFGITGPSGSGKSTLCYAIAGLIPHQIKLPLNLDDGIKGEIRVLGEAVTAIKNENGKPTITGTGSMSPEVGLVMQDPESQFLSMSVMNEMSLGLQMMGLDKSEMEERIRSAMEMVGLGELYQGASRIHPSELSGGQKQRLVIASFLAMKPKILILDEPTSDLDPKGKLEVIETIAKLKSESKMTIILVEHNPELMLKFAGRMAVLYEGSLIAVDKPSKIYSNNELTKKYNVYTPEISELSEYFSIDERPKVTIEKSGFSIERAIQKHNDSIISMKNIGFSYDDGTKALENIDLNIEKGSLVALVGQNGSGKSTLSKIISGILPPSSGTMEIAGIRPTNKKTRAKLPMHVSYVFQNPDHQIFTRSVTDEIKYSLNNAGITGTHASEMVSGILEKVGLSDKADEDPVFLGRGQKRRLAVASSIVLKPEILIVDEPTTGQDYHMSTEIMELIKKLNDEGVTIILITHDMRLVAEYCRRVLVMSRGSLVFDGTPESLFMNDHILKLSSLSEPQSVRLSKEMINIGILKEPFISAKEWLEFFDFMKSKTSITFRSFGDIEKAKLKILNKISSFGKPSGIISIERGGMILGSMLAESLNCESYSISASHYNEIGALTKDVNVNGIESLDLKPKELYVVVDELVDTGKTLDTIMHVLKQRFPDSKFLTCTMIAKPHSIIKPDITAEEAENTTWVVFDYEKNESICEFKASNPKMLNELNEHFSTKLDNRYAKETALMENAFKYSGKNPDVIIYENPTTAIYARLASDILGIKKLIGVRNGDSVKRHGAYSCAAIISSNDKAAEGLKSLIDSKDKIVINIGIMKIGE